MSKKKEDELAVLDMTEIIKNHAKTIDSLHATYHGVFEQKTFEDKAACAALEEDIFRFCDFWIVDGDVDNWIAMHNALCYGLMGTDEGKFEKMTQSNDLAASQFASMKAKYGTLSDSDKYSFMD